MLNQLQKIEQLSRTEEYVEIPEEIFGWKLAQKEIFMYLYFASCGKVPSNALVEAVCNNPNDFKNPTVVTKEEAHT